MRVPLESIVDTVKLGASVRGEADTPVRVGVYVCLLYTSDAADE